MGNHDWAIIIGYGIVFTLGIYIVLKIMGIHLRTIEGLTGTNSSSVGAKLKQVQHNSKVQQDNLHLSKYRGKYQDILAAVEETTAVEQLNLIMNSPNGVPNATDMDTYLKYDKFRDSLKELDDYLDTLGDSLDGVKSTFSSWTSDDNGKKKKSGKGSSSDSWF